MNLGGGRATPLPNEFYEDKNIEEVARIMGIKVVIIQNTGATISGEWTDRVIACHIYNSSGGSNGTIYIPYVDRLHFPNGDELNKCLKWYI